MELKLNRNFKFVLILLILLSLTVSSANMVSAKDYVIANTHDWKAVYELSMYANFKNMSFTYLKDLGDAEIKTKLMSKDDNLIVFESTSNPVVKNFDSFLKVNGYDLVGRYSFNNIFDLQEYLHDQIKPSSDYIFGTDFGMEPLVSAPYMLKNKIFPLFYSKDSEDFFYRISRRENIKVIGRVPVRAALKLKNTKLEIGDPKTITDSLTKEGFEGLKSKWGIITRIDAVDLTTISEGKPLFVYFDPVYIDDLASLMKQSNIKDYEVIGGSLADISKLLESKTGENLNLMLKFGRKITNLQGMENKILNIDSMPFPYPQDKLEIQSIVYDSKNKVLLLTLKNDGNINLYTFSSIDFGGVAVSDSKPHEILVGESRTIPYELNTTKPEGNATLTIKYGYSFPLLNSLKGKNDVPIIKKPVKVESQSDNSKVDIGLAYLDPKSGTLLVEINKISGSNPILRGEILIDGKSYVSNSKTLSADTTQLVFKLPYVKNSDLLGKTLPIKVYFGEGKPRFETSKQVLIQEQKNDQLLIILAISVVVLIVLLLIFFFSKKKKHQKHNKMHRKH